MNTVTSITASTGGAMICYVVRIKWSAHTWIRTENSGKTETIMINMEAK